MGGPLDGLRVVDVTSTLTGAHISQTLADFGADVVLVEPPGGSPLRRQPAWPFWARGKRSVVLDLGVADDRAAAQELAASADVFVETWRPDVAERLGLGDDELRSRNPAAGVRVGHRLRTRQSVVAPQGLRTGRAGEDRWTPRVLGAVRPARTVVRRRALLHLHREPARTARHPRRAVRARDERTRSTRRHHLGAGDPRPRHVELAAHGDHRQVRRRLHRRTSRRTGSLDPPLPTVLPAHGRPVGRWPVHAVLADHRSALGRVHPHHGARRAARPARVEGRARLRRSRPSHRLLGARAARRAGEDLRRVAGRVRRRTRRVGRGLPLRQRAAASPADGARRPDGRDQRPGRGRGAATGSDRADDGDPGSPDEPCARARRAQRRDPRLACVDRNCACRHVRRRGTRRRSHRSPASP